jgi:hypothetical protein
MYNQLLLNMCDLFQQGTYCYWSPNSQTVRARRGEIPDKDRWMIHEIRIFCYTGTINFLLVVIPFNICIC